jgi:hypothetical protein
MFGHYIGQCYNFLLEQMNNATISFKNNARLYMLVI